jgi:hypothetical protein
VLEVYFCVVTYDGLCLLGIVLLGSLFIWLICFDVFISRIRYRFQFDY